MKDPESVKFFSPAIDLCIMRCYTLPAKEMVFLTSNLHTHTFRCRHAEGDVEDYVVRAINAGIKTLGFSEHAPYTYLTGYQSWWRLQPEEMPSYVEAVLTAREKHRGEIDILLGAELEYYPETFDILLDTLRKYPMDYLILGQHALNNEYDGIDTYEGSSSPEDLRDYVDACITGLGYGYFVYLAHPDLFSFSGDESVYRQEMGRLCAFCAEKDIPLEINMKGINAGRRYPSEQFYTLAKEHGCRFVVGMDAHSPDEIVQPETYPRYSELIEKCGITNVVEAVSLL